MRDCACRIRKQQKYMKVILKFFSKVVSIVKSVISCASNVAVKVDFHS